MGFSHKRVLITGGHGFIGSHVAIALIQRGYDVLVVDKTHQPSIDMSAHRTIVGNLCDPDLCRRAVRGIQIVLHLAANMGGMGTIHEKNDFAIYSENNTMSQNMIAASIEAGVEIFVYASSACVYPESLQDDICKEVSLHETDTWRNPPPSPQGLYGLEKLVTEQILHQFHSEISLRIARFHNVFGVGGAWDNGREKAPAAFLRKAFAAKLRGESPAEMEIWGDGSARRSFLWIGDCVEAVLRLVDIKTRDPVVVNIGSENSVSIQELADMALSCAGIHPPEVQFRYDLEKPIGVVSRNSNNSHVAETLHWSPTTSLKDGMVETGQWIQSELIARVRKMEMDERLSTLMRLQKSEIVDLEGEVITYALLLPVTSRGSHSVDVCLSRLGSFARSMLETTWRDRNALGETRYRVTVYLLIDADDEELIGDQPINRAEITFHEAGVLNVVSLPFSQHPHGQVCKLWRDCASLAYKDKCDYYLLVGDDVNFHDGGWMSRIHLEFTRIAAQRDVPFGFGCVAFTDTTFPGMPTFPVLHRVHMDIFKDSGVIPADGFTNQDGDPFLFQLYRRFGASSTIEHHLTNEIGGEASARYTKRSAEGWTFEPLDSATTQVEAWLTRKRSTAKRVLTLDVIIPCYRVDIPLLEHILALKSSPTCSVMFIIIVDDPTSPTIPILKQKHGHRFDMRIRVNGCNRGASYSRNRGLQESAAEWVHFLDDDVSPRNDLLLEDERVIRDHPSYGTGKIGPAGFVGLSCFPPPCNIFTYAVSLAGISWFWDIARPSKSSGFEEDLPWGVTANLITRRNVQDGIDFDLAFPKTGGGEDIDYCLRKRDYFVAKGGSGFSAAPNVVVVHQWWFGGQRSYARFIKWSIGDGGLISMYPQLTFRDVPNSAELLVVCCVVDVFRRGLRFSLALLLANILHDVYRHSFRDAHRARTIPSGSLSCLQRALATLESTFIRMSSEGGRLFGVLQRHEWGSITVRFDWFAKRAGDGPRKEERWNNVQRLVLAILLLWVL